MGRLEDPCVSLAKALRLGWSVVLSTKPAAREEENLLDGVGDVAAMLDYDGGPMRC